MAPAGPPLAPPLPGALRGGRAGAGVVGTVRGGREVPRGAGGDERDVVRHARLLEHGRRRRAAGPGAQGERSVRCHGRRRVLHPCVRPRQHYSCTLSLLGRSRSPEYCWLLLEI